MALFGRHKTAPEPATSTIQAPIDGTVVPLDSVADPVFSKGTMGPGIAVIPTSGDVCAPIGGTVVTAFPTGHAYGIRSHDGVEVLVHVGIDTVDLEGRGFTIGVTQGQRIRVGERLGTVDLAALQREGKDPTTLMVVLNAADFGGVEATATGAVRAGDPVLRIIGA